MQGVYPSSPAHSHVAPAGKREPQDSWKNMGKKEFVRTDGMGDRLVLVSKGAGKILILANF